jgi:hypothetical protein
VVTIFLSKVNVGLRNKMTNGRFKERRSMSADAHGKPMSGASTHHIANSWTSANAFRRSLGLALARLPFENSQTLVKRADHYSSPFGGSGAGAGAGSGAAGAGNVSDGGVAGGKGVVVAGASGSITVGIAPSGGISAGVTGGSGSP